MSCEEARTLSQPATSRTGATAEEARRHASALRLFRSGTAALRHVAADSMARSQKRICAIAALRLCTEPETSASIRAAIIGPMSMSPTETWPAMIAAVTDLAGRITGAHRTWLAPDGSGKAPIDTPAQGDGRPARARRPLRHPRRSHGGGRRHRKRPIGASGHSRHGMAAALSAAHLAAILFPDTLRRLYIVRDNDPAGDGARDSLIERANAAGIEAITLSPTFGDFNEDLRNSASMRSGPTSGCNSLRRMSPASWPKQHSRQRGRR